MTTTNFANYGFAIGASQRGAEQTGHTLHVKYMQASETEQTQARRDFCVNYLMGKYAYKYAQADKVASLPRGERSETEGRDYNNAQSNFNYRIVRDSGNVVTANHAKTVERAPAGLNAAIKELLATYTAAQIRAALRGA